MIRIMRGWEILSLETTPREKDHLFSPRGILKFPRVWDGEKWIIPDEIFQEEPFQEEFEIADEIRKEYPDVKETLFSTATVVDNGRAQFPILHEEIEDLFMSEKDTCCRIFISKYSYQELNSFIHNGEAILIHTKKRMRRILHTVYFVNKGGGIFVDKEGNGYSYKDSFRKEPDANFGVAINIRGGGILGYAWARNCIPFPDGEEI